jgi:hypothetical protein
MNALNEINKVLTNISYNVQMKRVEDDEWLTSERMAVSGLLVGI